MARLADLSSIANVHAKIAEATAVLLAFPFQACNAVPTCMHSSFFVQVHPHLALRCGS